MLRRIPRSFLFYGLVICFSLHNLEEVLTMPVFIAVNLARFPGPFQTVERWLAVSSAEIALAVSLLVLLLIGVSIQAYRKGEHSFWQQIWNMAAALLLMNAITHIVQGFYFLAYTPGLISAVLIELPVTCLVLAWLHSQDKVPIKRIVFWVVLGLPLEAVFSVAFILLSKLILTLV